MIDKQPQLTILGGVNGAGKSTIRDRYIQPDESKVIVIDPDKLSKKLQSQGIEKSVADQQGGREAIALFEQAIVERKDVFLEATLSGQTIFRRYDKAKANGYEVTTVYVGLQTAQDHKNRVKDRVKKGGHFIAEDTIDHRFNQAYTQLEKAFEKSDNFKYYNNMDATPLLSFEKLKDQPFITRYDNADWTNTISEKLSATYQIKITYQDN